MKNYEISTSLASIENINAYSKLLSEVFSKTSKFTPGFLHWQYTQNPNGTVVGSDAFFNDSLVAHHAAIPVVYNIFGKQYKGLLAINNVTHPDHQGKGLFTELGRRTFEEAKLLGYQFVITATNKNSTYGYLNKFGFRELSPLDVKIGIGKIIPSNYSDHQVHSIWTDESIAWRFQNPSVRYYYDNKTIISKTDLLGVYAQIKNCSELNMDKIKLESKKSYFSLWIGLFEIKKKGFFFNLPNKLKPSPLNLLFKDLQGNIPLFSKDDLHFELADFDAF